MTNKREFNIDAFVTEKKYIATIDTVIECCSSILQNPIHIHYTDHSINHSYRILNIVSQILSQSKIKLNEEEGFILCSAILLHDIGMQTPNYGEETNKTSTSLTTEDLESIRNNHHIYTEMFITDSLNGNSKDRYYLGLDGQRELVDDIITVAKHHRKLNINDLDDDHVGDSTIRLKLLSSLIRLGDALDIDYRRIIIERLKSLNIENESKIHWYSHYYVQSVSIVDLRVSIHFKFPESYRNKPSVKSFIVSKVEEEISDQIDELYEILDTYKIRLYKEITTKISFSRFKHELPDELALFINKKNRKAMESSVIYKPFNINKRSELMKYYSKSLQNTQSYRTMLMGPYFLSPSWFLERKNMNRNYPDFEKELFQNILLNKYKETKIIFTNTQRYVQKIKQYLYSPEDVQVFLNDVLNNIDLVLGTENPDRPKICCFDPGYLHITTVSDNLAIKTQRVGRMEPTNHGFFITDLEQIEYIKNEFDDIFNYNYSNNENGLKKLKDFVKKNIKWVSP